MRRKKTGITKIRNEKGEIKTNKKVLRDYFEDIY
jgi:hypothetical protein